MNSPPLRRGRAVFGRDVLIRGLRRVLHGPDPGRHAVHQIQRKDRALATPPAYSLASETGEGFPYVPIMIAVVGIIFAVVL